jgi:hypothetical protein
MLNSVPLYSSAIEAYRNSSNSEPGAGWCIAVIEELRPRCGEMAYRTSAQPRLAKSSLNNARQSSTGLFGGEHSRGGAADLL